MHGGRMDMREIKFRGKRVDNGRWVEGYLYLFSPNSEDSALHIQERAVGDWYSYEVDPQTVGQFTGLQDSKGRDIYEGDYINDGEYTDRVVWKYASWYVEGAEDLAHTYNTGSNIVGNVHDGEWVESDEVGFILVEDHGGEV
jgi:uncharacterized phage protein (TIGR01671 family)